MKTIVNSSDSMNRNMGGNQCRDAERFPTQVLRAHAPRIHAFHPTDNVSLPGSDVTGANVADARARLSFVLAQRGDSVNGLLHGFGGLNRTISAAEVAEFARLNHLDNPNRIDAGRVYRVPSAASAPYPHVKSLTVVPADVIDDQVPGGVITTEPVANGSAHVLRNLIPSRHPWDEIPLDGFSR